MIDSLSSLDWTVVIGLVLTFSILVFSTGLLNKKRGASQRSISTNKERNIFSDSLKNFLYLISGILVIFFGSFYLVYSLVYSKETTVTTNKKHFYTTALDKSSALIKELSYQYKGRKISSVIIKVTRESLTGTYYIAYKYHDPKFVDDGIIIKAETNRKAEIVPLTTLMNDAKIVSIPHWAKREDMIYKKFYTIALSIDEYGKIKAFKMIDKDILAEKQIKKVLPNIKVKPRTDYFGYGYKSIIHAEIGISKDFPIISQRNLAINEN